MSKVQPSIICYYQPPNMGMGIPPTQVFIDTDGKKATAEYCINISGKKDHSANIEWANQELNRIFPNNGFTGLNKAYKLSDAEYNMYVDLTKVVPEIRRRESRDVPVTNFPTSF
jgi:hypothetical protein